MTGASARRVGDHFKESGISARAADVAVVVGSVAFAICGSVGVIAATTSFLTTPGSIASVRPMSATIAAGDDAETPLGGGTKPTSDGKEPEGGSDNESSLGGTSSQDNDSTDADEVAVGDDTSDDAQKSDSDAKAEKIDKTAQPGVVEVEPVAEPTVYIVQRGDTLSSISARYGVSVDKIANENQIRDVNLIYTGSALVIPA